jgi:sirohydrochlorin ferrochelatase
MAEDIPLQVATVQMSVPQVKIELLQPIGEHPRVKALFREISLDYARD